MKAAEPCTVGALLEALEPCDQDQLVYFDFLGYCPIFEYIVSSSGMGIRCSNNDYLSVRNLVHLLHEAEEHWPVPRDMLMWVAPPYAPDDSKTHTCITGVHVAHNRVILTTAYREQ